MGENLSDTQTHEENVGLVRRLLQHADFQHQTRNARRRDALRYLLKLYETDPGAAAREAHLAKAVFGRELDLGDSQMRRVVGGLRSWLQRNTNNDSDILQRRVQIPLHRYQLEFVPIEQGRPLLPTDWFWGEYLSANCSFATIHHLWGTRPEVNGWIPDRKPEAILEVYRAFADLTGHLPGLLGDFALRHPWDRAPILAVGPPDAYDSNLREVWKSSKEKPIVFSVDANHRVLVSDPNPQAKSLGLYAETDETGYSVVTRMTVPDRTLLTIIQASTSEAISRTMEFLASDDDLSSVVMAEELGGAELKKPLPATFQLLFEMDVELGYAASEGYDATPTKCGPAKHIVTRVLPGKVS